MSNSDFALTPLPGNTNVALYQMPGTSDLIRRGLKELEVQDAEYWFRRGEEQRKLGDNRKAIDDYRRALEIDGLHVDARFFLGLSWLHYECECFRDYPQGTHQLCIQQASITYRQLMSVCKLLGKKPGSGVFNNYALTLDRMGKPDEAFPYFEKAVLADPTSYASWTNLGSACMEREELERARDCLEKALDLNDGYYFTWYALAEMHAAMKRPDDELRAWKRYLKLVDHGRLRNAKAIEYAEKRIRELEEGDCGKGGPAA